MRLIGEVQKIVLGQSLTQSLEDRQPTDTRIEDADHRGSAPLQPPRPPTSVRGLQAAGPGGLLLITAIPSATFCRKAGFLSFAASWGLERKAASTRTAGIVVCRTT